MPMFESASSRECAMMRDIVVAADVDGLCTPSQHAEMPFKRAGSRLVVIENLNLVEYMSSSLFTLQEPQTDVPSLIAQSSARG